MAISGSICASGYSVLIHLILYVTKKYLWLYLEWGLWSQFLLLPVWPLYACFLEGQYFCHMRFVKRDELGVFFQRIAKIAVCEAVSARLPDLDNGAIT